MAHFSLNQYLQQLDNSWRSKDGNLLSELLSFRHGHVASSKLQIENPETQVERMIDPPLDEIIAAHLRCIWAINNQDYVEGYRCQSLVVQALTKVLQTQREENWALPVMYTVCLDLRLMAANADRAIASQADKRTETLEKAAKCLMDCFRICASDNRSSEEYTKRWGMLTLVNQLFKVYFSINKLHLCKPLIRAIESSPLKDHFSLSQQVTYKYYVGRKAMFDSNYKMADEYLSFAFKRCHKDSWNNKRLILIYLIPVKMLLGYMPKRALLQKYDLLQFLEIVEAVKQGNLQQFNKMMDVHESFLIQCGIFLILEKLKIICYRNLFKKVYLLMKTHQLPTETLLIALKCMDIPDIDLDETECIVANLIFEGKIKGYISHQHKKLVVSKQNPFPLLNTVM